MYQRLSLIADRMRHFRVGVPKAADRDAGQGIKVAFPLGIPEPDAFPPFEGDRKPIVGILQDVNHLQASPWGCTDQCFP